MTTLNEDLDLFRETDAALTSLLEPLRVKSGWTIVSIEEEVEHMKPRSVNLVALDKPKTREYALVKLIKFVTV